MLIVDDSGILSQFLGDPKRRIPKAHLLRVCKIGQAGSCRYAAKTIPDPKGSPVWVCAKNTPTKGKIDAAVAAGVFKKNTCDNCDGFGTLGS